MGFGNPIQMLAAASIIFITSAVIVLLGIVYMGVSIFIIKASTGIVGIGELDPNYLVLTAAILSGSALMATRGKN